MARKIKPATIEDRASVDLAVMLLKDARNSLRAAGALIAAAKVRRALKSAEGAQRHVRHRLLRMEHPDV